MNGRLMEPAQVRVEEKKDGGGKWTLDSVTINQAENGFIVNKCMKRPGKEYPQYKSEQSVFNTKETMDDFVDRIFGVKD